MRLPAFVDELQRLHGWQGGMAKAAGGNMFVRLPAIGAAAGVGAHALQHLKALATRDPADEPQGGFAGAAGRTAVGGLTVAGLLHLIAKTKK